MYGSIWVGGFEVNDRFFDVVIVDVGMILVDVLVFFVWLCDVVCLVVLVSCVVFEVVVGFVE